jgi:hypothetical protein
VNSGGGNSAHVPVKGAGKNIAEAREELKQNISTKGKSWADIEEAADKTVTHFEAMLNSSEFKQIFTALNSTLPEVRQGGMKSLITYLVKSTPLSKNDVKAVAKSLSPQALVLRSAPQEAKKKNSSNEKPKKANPKNANLHRLEAELRALYPDYKTSGADSEYAQMKKHLVAIHKQGKTVRVPLVRGLSALTALPTEDLK